MNYFDPNDYTGSDIEKINSAVADAAKAGSFVRMGKRLPDENSSRDFWLIDSAILLPENMTFIICNTLIKLSDASRDNFFRTANAPLYNDGTEPSVINNVHIIGEGKAILEGAEHPRSTGDSNKFLGVQKIAPYPADGEDRSKRMTYGTDAGKEGENQKGDWRNIGVLFVKATDFSIENILIRKAHCWAISLEYCRKGVVRDIEFDTSEYRIVDGVEERMLNQDGLDLRRGCRDILIENITGCSGDDLIALTAIASKVRPAGTFNSVEYCGGSSDVSNDDVFNITIRNVRGYSGGGYFIIRFLNQKGVKMHHIFVDGLLETAPPGHYGWAAIKIGAPNYAGSAALGETYAFQIRNVRAQTRRGITFGAPLSDSVISDVLYFRCKEEHSITSHHGEGEYPLPNVFFHNMHSIDSFEK